MIPRQFAHLPPLLSLTLAAKAVGVSKRTLYVWMRAGKVQFVYTAGGQRQIVTETLWREVGPDQLPVAESRGTEELVINDTIGN